MTTLALTDPVAGTVADATLIANNDAAIKAVINGGIDNNNFAAGKIFDNTKIMQGGATNGQALVWNGTSWVPGSAGSVTMLADSTLGVAAAAFDTNTILGGNIPTGYKHLRIEFELRSDNASNDVEARLTFNNDTSAAYVAGGGFLGDNSATAYLGGSGLTNMPLSGGNIPAASMAAGIAAGGSIDIFNYLGTTFHKSAVWAVRGETGAVRMVAVGAGRWANTAAITRIALTPSLGNWIAGCRFTLYGLA